MREAPLHMEEVALVSPEGKQVFRDLHLTLEPGGRVRLDPISGSGTSALLHLAAGLIAPSKGRILVEGIPYAWGASYHPALAQGRVGWVPTTGGMLVNLTLLANVALPLRTARGMGRKEAEATAAGWLERAGLIHAAARRPHTFEPSIRWLGSLVRCAATQPLLWLVDRPPSILEEGIAIQAARIFQEGLGTDDAALVVDPPDGWSGLPDRYHIAEGLLRPGRAQ